MKILMISTDRNILQADSEVQKRMLEYGSLADELHIIVFTKRNDQVSSFKFQVSNNVWAYPTDSYSRWFYIFDAIKIGKRIVGIWDFGFGISVVTAQDPFETGFAGWLIARKSKIALQLQIHIDFFSPYFWKESHLNKIRVVLGKFLLPKANGIRAVSEVIKNYLVEKISIPKEKIVVLPVFTDVQEIAQTQPKFDLHKKYPNFDFIILMMSRLVKQKNIPLALEAMREVIVRHPKTGMIIVGDGPERANYELLIMNYGLRRNVILEKWTDDIVSYYKTADLFLSTSNYEGWGMTTVEALAAGCPVIMTNVGCAGEVVHSGKNGLVVPVGDEKALVTAVLKVLSGEAHLRAKTPKLPTKEEYLASYRASWKDAL